MTTSTDSLDFFVSFSHDRDGNHPTWSTLDGRCPNTTEIIDQIKAITRDNDWWATVFVGPGVVIRYDDDSFCGTDLDAATYARLVSPGGQISRIHI
jgi:hypothetical protein